MHRIVEAQSPAPDGEMVTIVEMSGHFDNNAAPRLKEVLARSLAEKRLRVALDCSRVEFMSSAALGAVLSVVHQFRKLGGDVKMAAVGEKVKAVMGILGLDEVLDCHPTVTAAVAKFASRKK